MRETSSARLSRLLSLIPWLEQHDGVSISEAAEHFGVPVADLERDLWMSICCGLPGHGPDQLIDIQFWDDDGRIRVIDTQALARPLRLTAAESTALLVGLRLLAQIPGQHDRSALASVTAKMEAAADRQGAPPAVLVDDDVARAGQAVAEAIAQGQAVRIVYAGASRDELTERVVEPGQIVDHRGRSYLVAWCRSAKAQRTFRIDRIRSAEVLDDTASAAIVAGSIPPAEGVRVRVRVRPRSRWLLETLDILDSVEGADGCHDATLTVADPAWLARLVLGQAGGVEVLQPPEVRVLVRRAADDALGRLVGPPAE